VRSKHHFLISLAVAAGAAVLLPSLHPATIVAIAVGVGVGIDFDHFLIARYNGDDWTAVRRCLRDPRIVFFEQGEIFDEGTVNAVERLLTHLVIGGVMVPVLWFWSPPIAAVAGVSLYAHLLADAISTVRNSVVLDVDEYEPGG
jgi:hypothetical protein